MSQLEQNDIDLTSIVHVLDARLVQQFPADPTGEAIGTATAVTQALRLEYRTFLDAGYVDSADDLIDEYRPYAPATTFLAVRTEAEVAGVARVIDASPAGFKTLNDIAAGRLHQSDPLPRHFAFEHCFEIGTLSIAREHRHSTVGLLLYGAMLQKSRSEGKRFLVASFDDGEDSSFLRDFEAHFPAGVRRLGQPQDYMGTPTTAVLIDMEEAYTGILKNPGIPAFLQSVQVQQPEPEVSAIRLPNAG